jgi:hypothetical protein
MPSTRTTVAALSALIALAALAVHAAPTPAPAPDHLPAFASERALEARLDVLRAVEARRRAAAVARMQATLAKAAKSSSGPVPVPAPPSPAAEPQAFSDGSAASAESTAILTAEQITNVQTQGVDEGGIVKKAGEYFVVLRRGRLFTVRATDARLEPVAALDAFGPGLDPSQAWYDEMLISGDTVVVIGYSYGRSGSEIGLFRLGADGSLRYLGTHHLRSDDYYSSRNYASRLIGDTLVFYAPLRLALDRPWRESLPGLRRWGEAPAASPDAFVPIAGARQIHDSGLETSGWNLTLHTVTRCRIRGAALDCKAQAVLGPSSENFYVSASAVYVWLTEQSRRGMIARASMLRIPLDGAPPQALRTSGAPIDQLSFLERDGWLNVLLSASGLGEGMWRSNAADGQMALLRVPLGSFGDHRASARPSHFRSVPGRGDWGLQNRFVGDWLLWSGGDDRNAINGLRYAAGAPATRMSLEHPVERIEALGDDALVVGANGDALYYTPLQLGELARTMPPFAQQGARQGESRTHGFFYRPDGPRSGLLGLPVLRGPRGEAGAAVSFLRNRQLALTRAGELAANPGPREDGCRASCVDWYGNARPIFAGGRAYALMGYELVEARIGDDGVHETRRVDFRPVALPTITN